ncbi:MAG: rhodanese-like domain-containing protein [Geobacteraceae bacterium]|nr:rhodanese-like domain-containing protein [Geobacteraceae bacterium]
MMRRYFGYGAWLGLFSAVLLLAGCGSTTTEKYSLTTTTASLEPASSEFPNANLLVSADSVQASLGSKGLVLIDARTTGYETAHIPGAINVKYGDYFTRKVGLKDTATLEGLLGSAGLTRESKVVIYDNTTASWGAAGRIFWMLEYLGCSDVHIMDGGWDKWLADGRPTQTKSVTLPAATFTAAVNSGLKVSSSRIAQRLYDSDFAVIDSRTDEEFLGWQLYGEARGGHISGAVQMPYAWFFNTDKTTLRYQNLKPLFESRGITPDKEVTAYCTAGIRSGYVYFLLRLMGYSRCSNYDASIWEWAENDELPMEKAARYETSVYPAWVKALIDYHVPGSGSAAPPQYPYDRSHKYLIFETHWGSIADMEQGWANNSYLLGHIPGAIHSNSDTYENGYPRWFLLPDDQLKTAVGSMGITADTTVVVYSDSPIFAARLWWILTYAGVADVRILNGGLTPWVAAGYPVETAINNPVPTTYAGTTRPEILAATDYVFNHYLDTVNTVLADVRSGGEYAGLISGYSYLVAKGRIPGAVWAGDGDDSSRVYTDADGTLRSFTEVRDHWNSLGITSDRELIFYCGGGYRSSLTFLYGYLMGYGNIRNYSDGWMGWSTTYTEDPSYLEQPTPGWIQTPSGRPVETGGL